MAFKSITVLALYILFAVDYSTEYIVEANCRSNSNSCKTLNDYANDDDAIFTSDSSFYFMKGTHHLNVTLFITNVVKLSFGGDESDIILSNGCSIVWTRSTKISMTSLNIIFNETNKTMGNVAMHFKNSKVKISDTLFSRFHQECNIHSRAITAMSSSIIFENSIFENGCHNLGGALHIKNCSITFWGHTMFQSNMAKKTAGALYCAKSQVHFNGSGTFVGNRAGSDNPLSYGTVIYAQSTNISFNGYFTFNNNKLLKSYYRYNRGGAIATSSSSLTMQGVFYFINNSNIYGGALFLRDTKCLIRGQAAFVGNEAINNGGAINARSSSLMLQSEYLYNSSVSYSSECLSKSYPQSILFCNNSAGELGGAVNLNESNMTLTGAVSFVANQAQSGGGISVYYTSEPGVSQPNFVVFQEPLDLLFYANVAKGIGGAMYINDIYLDARLCEYLIHHRNLISCFFTLKYGFMSFNLNFTSNKALAGEGIYGGAIQSCWLEVPAFKKKKNGYIILQKVMKTSTNIQNLYANFDALETRYCINGTTPDLYYRSVDIRVQRGQVFNISVTLLGEFDFAVSERVAFALNSNEERSSSQIFGEPYNYLKKKGCRSVGFRILSELQREQLTLNPPQCRLETSILTVNVYLDDCSPGFVLTDNACKCQDLFFKVTGHEDLCDSGTGRIKCPQQDWMKPILKGNQTYKGFMWSPNCPSHLCRNDKDNWLNFSSDNVDCLCLEHRTAMLCGTCLQNYSLTLSSLKCSKCNSNNYLSLLLVFALAGVSLIASLLLLRITVADGTVNGLIFYANIINIIEDHIFPQDKVHTDPLTIFISWLNLDFGIPTCFYTGLNYYSYTWLQFVFPFYLWFLVGLIILACKYSSRAMKLIGSNPVAVLATVVLMSYSKLLHTSQQILSYVTLYYSNGTQEKRWKIDPNLHYFQGYHFPLAMFGMFVVIAFLIPYVVLISFGHYLQKYSNKRGLKWLIKIKPILDAYYAPFCKNTRYWAGLTLFVRACLSITYTTLENTEHITILVIVPSVLTGITLILWLQHKIYQKRFLNMLEGSFIVNIIILSIATQHITKERNTHQLILTYTSVAIAFIEFLAIVAVHAWHRLNLKWLYMKWTQYRKTFNNNRSSNQCAAKVKDLDKPRGNVSTTMVFNIREPLLDDGITEL